MRAERLAQAALLRARGQEAAQSLRAIADRQSVEILAAARRDSEVLRGEGDAERSRIFADAFNADPEFFEFYRAMEAYRNALAASGTTMVLSPNTEFFSYFNSDAVQGGSGPAPAPQPQPSAPTPAPAPAEDATWSDLLTGTVEPPALGGTGAGIEPTTPSDTPPSPPEAVPEPATEPNPLVPAEELGAAAPTP
jgi:membrane protease subunit HflC